MRNINTITRTATGVLLAATLSLSLWGCGGGSDGSQGIQGLQGATGATGANGADGTNGETGATGAQGQPGASGAQGPPGTAGTPGSTGETGAPGATGAQGDPGVPGQNGSDGAPGQNGANGSNGTNGTNGTNGKDGANGATGPQGPYLLILGPDNVALPSNTVVNFGAKIALKATVSGIDGGITFTVSPQAGAPVGGKINDTNKADLLAEFEAPGANASPDTGFYTLRAASTTKPEIYVETTIMVAKPGSLGGTIF